MIFFFSGPFLLYVFWNYISYTHFAGIQSHHRTRVLTLFIVLPSYRYLFQEHSKGDIAASSAGSKTPLISHYRTESFHPILDFRKLNLFLYRINYHLPTINAIIPSLLQHDLFYEIRSWVVLSREISFLFLLGQWLFKHIVSAFGIATVSLVYYMLFSSSRS